jgi:hypothetical protein
MMTPDETGKFCGSCVKSVVDFTGMKASEIQDYFTENKGKNICGRFKDKQINTFNLEIPQSALHRKMSFHHAFVLALFIVMGSTLFSCRNQDNNTLGEVTVMSDTIRQDSVPTGHATLGIVMPEEDSLSPRPTPKNDKLQVVKEPLKTKAKAQKRKTREHAEDVMIVGIVTAEADRDTIITEKK